jgi:hypothetical protein
MSKVQTPKLLTPERPQSVAQSTNISPSGGEDTAQSFRATEKTESEICSTFSGNIPQFSAKLDLREEVRWGISSIGRVPHSRFLGNRLCTSTI